MLLALKLFASGAFDALMRGVSAATEWLLEDWRNFALALLAALYIFFNWVYIPGLRRDLADTAAQLEASQLAHLGTIENFIDASAEAQRQAEANVARVRAEQEVINREVTRACAPNRRSSTVKSPAICAAILLLSLPALTACGREPPQPIPATPTRLVCPALARPPAELLVRPAILTFAPPES